MSRPHFTFKFSTSLRLHTQSTASFSRLPCNISSFSCYSSELLVSSSSSSFPHHYSMQYLCRVEVPCRRGYQANAANQVKGDGLVACNDYTAVTRNPQNQWTSMQRTILGFLATSYSNPWSEISKIFNACFRDELSNPLSMQAIRSMAYDMKLEMEEKAAIASMKYSPSSTISSGLEGVIQALVRRTASDLSIQLVINEPEPSSRARQLSQYQVHSKRKADLLDHDGPDDCPNAFKTSDTYSAAESSSKRRCTPTKKDTNQNIGLLSPPFTKKTNRNFQNFTVPIRSLSTPGFQIRQSSPASRAESFPEDMSGAQSLAVPSLSSLRDFKPSGDDTRHKDRMRLPRLAFRTFDDKSMGINGPQLFGMYFHILNAQSQGTFQIQHPLHFLGNTDAKREQLQAYLLR